MKTGKGQIYIKLAAVLLLFLITGCATKPGVKSSKDMAIWVDKAAQAGCNNLSQVINVSVSDDAIANAMLRIAGKTGLDKGSAAENQLTAFFANPENGSILVISKINSHALDAIESFIKRWKGEASPSSPPHLCVCSRR